MIKLLSYPILFAVISLALLWLSVYAGTLARKARTLHPEERQDFGVILRIGKNASKLLMLMVLVLSISLN